MVLAQETAKTCTVCHLVNACATAPAGKTPGLGDDGELGGLGVGVTRREPAGDGDGRKEDLHVCPDKASWLMQGLQRERHAQTNQKPKTET